ncbi:MAG TPA: ribosome maturation factor RimM [Candidatus Enterocloster excrementipullorum]|uniref:Ribosome maturation factor RimM n=1 Tax=Candidatus Enterocloster excrementipullorum TaxID=2838559 RepID=A0A9D2MYA6_9FIRM|nr:ribosome maturation factor RimM [Candidatus Enterocloster excrementipullorum]
MEEMLRVGVITTTHGVRGEVKVYPTTDDAERFLELEEIWLDTGKKRLPLKIQNVKFFKNMVILKFEGYDDINAVQAWRQKDLLVTREQAVELQEDEYFIGDLIGLHVEDEEGNALGVLRDVLETGANDVYLVSRPGEKDLMLPAIKECIRKVDLEAGIMRVRVLPGLLDL